MPNFASLIGTTAITAATLAFGGAVLSSHATPVSTAPAAATKPLSDETLAELQARLDAQEAARLDLAAQLEAARAAKALEAAKAAAAAKLAAAAPVKKVVVVTAPAPVVAQPDTLTGGSGSYTGGTDTGTGGSGSYTGEESHDSSDDHSASDDHLTTDH